MDNCFWALFTNLGFCEKKLRRENSFSLYLHCQPSVNNRDIEMAWVNEPSGKKHSPWEYMVQLTDDSKKARDDEMEQSDAHHILLSRKSRDEVDDRSLAVKLAHHHHMWEKASTGDDKEDRCAGLKIACDQVSVIATFEEASRLFETLTVSPGKSKMPNSISPSSVCQLFVNVLSLYSPLFLSYSGPGCCRYYEL